MSDVLTKQVNFLRRLSMTPGSSIEVMLRPQSQWLPLFEVITNLPDKPIHSRTILKNEIVLEIDSDDWAEVRDGTRRIIKVLGDLGAAGTFYLSFSGNRSIHVHVFLDLSLKINPDVSNLLQGKDGVIASVKHYLMTQIARMSDTTIDMQLSGKHLIRMEGGFNEKSHKFCTMLQEVPEERPKYYNIEIPTDTPPEQWNLDRFSKEINAFLKIHFRTHTPPVQYRTTGRSFDPEPLKEILKPVFLPGYRHYMVLSLSGWVKRHGIPEHKALEIVRALNPQDRTPSKTAFTVHETYRAKPQGKVAGLPSLLNLIRQMESTGKIPSETAKAAISELQALNRGLKEVQP